MTKGVVLSSIAPGAMSGQDAVPSTTLTLVSGGTESVPVTLLSVLSVGFLREKKTWSRSPGSGTESPFPPT
jgi:hypothetical protein